jgi:hypothetical protein
VTLTGLSSETFAKAVSNCHNMYTKMLDYFPADAINTWQSTTYEGHAAVDLHACYFTMRKNAPNEANIPFTDGVDPDGALSVRGQSLPAFLFFRLFRQSEPNRQLPSAVLLTERTVEAQPLLLQPPLHFRHCRKRLPHVPF